MNVSAISREAWNATMHFIEKDRFNGLRGLAFFGKLSNYAQNKGLSDSAVVKNCSSALACVYPLEFLADVKSFYESFQSGKTFDNKFYNFAVMVEAFPRSYDVAADFFGWKKENIPGGETVRTLCVAAGVYEGGKIAYDAVSKLRDEKDLTTSKKIEQVSWTIFGFGFVIAYGVSLAKRVNIVDEKKVPIWVSLATSTMTTLGFLTATYIKNTK